MKLSTHEELIKHDGKSVTCEIEGEKITDAKISVNERGVFICQNTHEGTICNNKKGYKYSWRVSSDKNNYQRFNHDCTNIILIDELTRGQKVWVSDISEERAREIKEENFYLANVGGKHPHVCVISTTTEKYPDGDYYNNSWKYAIPVREPTPKKMTVKEVCEKLGYDIEIVKEER